MGRIKYDINLKPIADTDCYQVRFTNQEAMDIFIQIGIIKSIYKENNTNYILNKWMPIPNSLVNSIKYSISLNKFSIKAEYIKNSDFEHYLK